MSIAQRVIPIEGTRSRYRWMVLLLFWLAFTMFWLAFTMASVDRSTWGPASVFVGKDLSVPLASLGVFATSYYIGYVISNASVASRPTASVAVGSFRSRCSARARS
jgi:hypothetical protein